jgi:hypothetical protein
VVGLDTSISHRIKTRVDNITIIREVCFISDIGLQEGNKLIRVIEARHIKREAKCMSTFTFMKKMFTYKSLNPCTPAHLNSWEEVVAA